MTDVTALIQELVDAGCDPVVAGSVVARALATGVSTAPWRAMTNAERQAAYRARNGVTKSNESNENVTPVTQRCISLDSDSKEVKKERKIQRGTRIAPDWRLDEADRAFARDQGMPPDLIDRTAADFRDYWLGVSGAAGIKLDWSATWRNRVRFVCGKMGLATGPPKSALPEAELMILRERYAQKQREQM